MYYVEQSGTFEAIFESGISGAVGTIEVQIQDGQGNVVSGPSTLGIIESPAGSGWYHATLTAPAALGQYGIAWSLDGSFDEQHISIDDLTVVAAGAGDALPPLTPIGPGPGAQEGPCNTWTTEEAVAACCSATDVGTDYELYSEFVDAASVILWQESGRLYSGTCDDTVRPCQTDCGCFGQVLSRGHLVNWDGCSWGTSYCGCRPLSTVLLSGYPIREVVQVKIDGAVVDPDTYRLDDRRKLVRVRELDTDDALFWPSCQALDLPDTEDGTFSVRYTFGQNPPKSGQDAAAELACQMYLQCSGSDECRLPQGATVINRQGVRIERQFFRRDPMTGAWRTGLAAVDLFLNQVNPNGLARRPSVWGPGMQRFARRVGA